MKARLLEDVGESARDEKITLKDVVNVFKDCKPQTANLTRHGHWYEIGY